MHIRRITAACLLTLSSSSLFALDLLEAYRRAVATDPNFQAMAFGHEAEQFDVDLARGRLFPIVGLKGSVTMQQLHLDPQSVFSAKVHNVLTSLNLVNDRMVKRQVGVVVKQPLFRYDLWQQYQQAKISTELSDVNFQANRQNYMLAVAELYFNILRLHALTESYQKEEDVLSKQLTMMSARLNEGIVARMDVAEAKAQFQNAQANRIAAQEQYRAINERLEGMIGKVNESLARLRTDMQYQTPIPANVDEWIKLAVEKNLGVQQAKIMHRLAQKQREVQKANYYPQVEFTGAVGWQEQDNESFLSPSTGRLEQMSVEVNMPLLNGGLTRTSMNKAQSQAYAAEARLEAARRAAKTDASSAFHQVINDEARIRSKQTAANSANLVADATRASYDAGLRSMVDVLLAQRNSFAIQQDAINARYDYVLRVLKLRASVGQLGITDLQEINDWLE